MKKIGIIRCQQTEDLCPGTTDFLTAAQGKGAFAPFGECQVIGFVSCGGCPGKHAATRAKMLVERGADLPLLRYGAALLLVCVSIVVVNRAEEAQA